MNRQFGFQLVLVIALLVNFSFAQLSTPASYACCSSTAGFQLTPHDLPGINWAAYTVEFWIGVGDKDSTFSSPVTPILKGTGSVPYPLRIQWGGTPFTLFFRGQSTAGWPDFEHGVSVTPVANNIVWHHFALVTTTVFNGIDLDIQKRYYLDGALSNSINYMFSPTGANTEDFLICQTGDPMLISEVRVWDAVLSDANIAFRWNSRLTGAEPNLYAYWPLAGDLTSGNGGTALIPLGTGFATFFGTPACDVVINSLVNVPFTPPPSSDPSFTATVSVSPSNSESSSASATISLSQTPDATRTATVSATLSRSTTPSASVSRSQLASPSSTPSMVSPSSTPSFSNTPSISPSFNPCAACRFPVGNSRVQLHSTLAFNCPTTPVSGTGMIMIDTADMDILRIPATFSVECAGSNDPQYTVTLLDVPITYSFGPTPQFLVATLVSGSLQQDITNDWTGSLIFGITSISDLSVTQTNSQAVPVTGALGLASSVQGAFDFDSTSTSGLSIESGSIIITVPTVTPFCPTIDASGSVQGQWTTDYIDTQVAYTGRISSVICDTGALKLSGSATYSLSAINTSFEMELIAYLEPGSSSWSGVANGTTDIAGVTSTLDVVFSNIIDSRTITGSTSASVSNGPTVDVLGAIEYPTVCDPDFPFAVGIGSIHINDFPFGLPVEVNLDSDSVFVLFSCAGSGYWGFTSEVGSTTSFSVAGLPSISLVGSQRLIVDFGCPPLLPGDQYSLRAYEVLGSRTLLLPNTRTTTCEDTSVQATVYGDWDELLLLASVDLEAGSPAVRAVSPSLFNIRSIITAISSSGGLSFPGDVSTNPVVQSFTNDILSDLSLSEISVLFDITSKTLTTDCTLTFFGVEVQGFLIYLVDSKTYAIGVGIDPEASMSGPVGSIIAETINTLGLFNAYVVTTSGPIDFVLPDETEVSLSNKGTVVSAKLNIGNNVLAENIPGFQELMDSLGSFLPSAPPDQILSVLVRLEGVPSTVSISILLSDDPVPLTSDGNWVLASTSLFLQKGPLGFTVGIQADIKLTVPNDPPFVVNFVGIFTYDVVAQTLSLEAGANSKQLWQPSSAVDIYVAFPWAISMGINVITGPVSIGFTGSLKFGTALGTATVYIDLIKVVNSGFAFSVTNFNLRNFLAVFRINFSNGSTVASILESFSISSLSVSYSTLGYTSPSGLISIPAGFMLDAKMVNLFNIIKIIELKAQVTPGNGFTFNGVMEKMKLGGLALAHPSDSSLGPQVDMAMTASAQNMNINGKVTLLNFFTSEGTAFLDVQKGTLDASVGFSFGNSCPSGPPVTAMFSVGYSISPSWSDPRTSLGFGVDFSANFGAAVSCLLNSGIEFLVKAFQIAIEGARQALRWASDRLAEAEAVLAREIARISTTKAEEDLAQARAAVESQTRRCRGISCGWRFWRCFEKGSCYAALYVAKAALKALEKTVEAAGNLAKVTLSFIQSGVSLARSGLSEAEDGLDFLNNALNEVPGLLAATLGDFGDFLNYALKVNKLQVNGTASISTTPDSSFNLLADLVIFGNPVRYNGAVSLRIPSILDKFIGRVKSGFSDFVNFKKLKKRDASSLRDPSTGRLTFLTVNTRSESLSYIGNNIFDELKPLVGEVPWTELCSGNFDSLFRIDFSGNELTGGIDSCIFTDSPLEVIYLRDNKLSGDIDFPKRPVDKLRSFSVAKNSFDMELTSSSGITNFRNLESLDLSNNNFRGSIEVFRHFKKLQFLNIDNNQFEENANYGISNLLLDLPNIRAIYYGNNKKMSRGIKYQPYPFRIHGQIQVSLDYDFFCKEVEIGDRYSNCRLSEDHNKNLVSDFEVVISRWIKEKWEDKFSFSYSSYLSLVDPSKGETQVKTILPMRTQYYGKKADPDGGTNTLLAFVYTYPNPNPTGNELKSTISNRDKKDRDFEEAVRGFMRRMAVVIEEEMEGLNFTTRWTSLEYSEFSRRRTQLTTRDKPLPKQTRSYSIKTRKAVLGCPAGWVGDDCQYFCENGWKSTDRFTNQYSYQTAQNATELSWDILESSGVTPSCVLPLTLCNSKKCNNAVYEVHHSCGRWVLDQCGSSENFPGSKKDSDTLTNYEKCADALEEADRECKEESYDCSGSVVKSFGELMDDFSMKSCEKEKEKEEKREKEKEKDGNSDDSGRRDSDNNGDQEDIAGWMIALIVVSCVVGAAVIALTVVLTLLFLRK